MVYLGSSVHADGKFTSEMARKIGTATADFKALEVVWKRSTVAMKRKIQLFDSCIVSRLKYAIASAWVLKADLRRLDGFQTSCLRTLLGIRPAYYSRVSNARVREIAGQPPLSEKVRSIQQKLLQAVLSNPDKKVLRDVTFHTGTCIPLTSRYVRKIGRPKQTRVDELMKSNV